MRGFRWYSVEASVARIGRQTDPDQSAPAPGPAPALAPPPPETNLSIRSSSFAFIPVSPNTDSCLSCRWLMAVWRGRGECVHG